MTLFGDWILIRFFFLIVFVEITKDFKSSNFIINTDCVLSVSL